MTLREKSRLDVSADLCELPEELPFLHRPCGCGEEGDRDFLPGHDVRAIQARVREHCDSSPLKFVQWVDQTLADAAATRP